MRINELARHLGQKYNQEIKAGDLVREFKSLGQFAEISDTVKSHSSSVDDKYIRLMLEVYEGRLGKGSAAPESALTKGASAPPPAHAPAAVATPIKTISPAALKPAGARPAPDASTHAAKSPAPSPSHAGSPRPSSAVAPRPSGVLPPKPSPAAHGLAPLPRPAPIGGGIRPTSPIPAVRRPEPIAAHGEGKPELGADSAPVRATAPTAVPLRPSGTAPAAPRTETQPPRPNAPHGAQEMRSVPPGQPAARIGQMQAARPQKFRPTGLATELRSSSGTTGFTAQPEAARRGLLARGGAGQPSAPAMPKFSTDSPFTKPRPSERPPERRGEAGRGPGARPDSRPEARGGERRGPGKPAGAPMGEILTVPEIGVMKLKAKTGGGGPGRGGQYGKKGKERESEAAKAAKKKIIPSKVFGDADEFRRPLKPGGRRKGPVDHEPMQRAPVEVKPIGPIILTGPVTVAEFAEKLGIPTVELIKKAFLKGKGITINQLINFELAEEIAFEMEIDLLIRPEGDETDLESHRANAEDKPEDYRTRPPVVTIMGHVDHGKTTILDFYRRSRVVEGEFGGITQHIGAYQVETQRGTIVFLDTPGHEAFTAMRARGVKATDIVVLVVSADDGVMPQTVEAINHAKAAGVPLIVAINKIDLPAANPERIRTDLLQYNVVSTALGGDTEFVEVSAKKGTNMEALLEIISIQAEVLELKSNPERPAEGIVIESHVDPLRGSVATILIQQGTLKVGDIFVVGQQYGRVRAMMDDIGRPINEANLSRPVELIGLTGAPETGEILLEMQDERIARAIAEKRLQRRRLLELGTTRHVSLEGLHDMIADGQIKELNVILKADVQGSVEAIMQALDKAAANEIRVRVLHAGTGPINEGDVNLAVASSAVVIGFNVRPETRAEELAMREHVQIKTYRIIYELLEDMEKALLGMLEKKYAEQQQGRAEVRQVFRVTKIGTIAGCMVASGEIVRGAQARLIRDNAVVYEGKVGSLRRLKDDVTKVASGYECGIGLDRFGDVKEGDIIETFTMQEMAAELTRA